MHQQPRDKYSTHNPDIKPIFVVINLNISYKYETNISVT